MITKIIKMLIISILITATTFVVNNIDRNNYKDPKKLYNKINQSLIDAKINLAQVIEIKKLINQSSAVDIESKTESKTKSKTKSKTESKTDANSLLESITDQKNLEQNLIIAKENLTNVQNHLESINDYPTTKPATGDNNNPIQLLEQLGNQGSSNCQFILGLLYQYGFLVVKDKNKAIAWYQKAANQGDNNAKKKLKYLLIN